MQEILQKNVPKILDLKSSSEQIFSENCRWHGAPDQWLIHLVFKYRKRQAEKSLLMHSCAIKGVLSYHFRF